MGARYAAHVQVLGCACSFANCVKRLQRPYAECTQALPKADQASHFIAGACWSTHTLPCYFHACRVALVPASASLTAHVQCCALCKSCFCLHPEHRACLLGNRWQPLAQHLGDGGGCSWVVILQCTVHIPNPIEFKAQQPSCRPPSLQQTCRQARLISLNAAHCMQHCANAATPFPKVGCRLL